MFVVFGAVHFPFEIPFKKLQNRTFFFSSLAPRDPVLEQVLDLMSDRTPFFFTNVKSDFTNVKSD